MAHFLDSKRTRRVLLLLGLVLLLLGFSSIFDRGEKAMEERTIGERFHQETSLSWRGAISDVLGRKPPRPQTYKSYENAKRIALPKPDHEGLSVESAIQKRRSVRNYSGESMTLTELAQLLFAAQGITGRMYGEGLRAAPSAGALYPFEIYVVGNNVAGLDKGIYHYAVREHQLELVKAGDFTDDITEAAFEQEMLGEADVSFVLAAVINRARHKYGERGFRYIYMEAGHISQNIYLQASSLGLGSVAVGAFLDDEVSKLIGVDGEKEVPIYLHAVGTL
jgi:SagB-type dehydrogenase family enzyme